MKQSIRWIKQKAVLRNIRNCRWGDVRIEAITIDSHFAKISVLVSDVERIIFDMKLKIEIYIRLSISG